MSFAPLLNAAQPIPLHAFAALAALAIAIWQLLARKGTGLHKALGWVFVVAMAVTAISAIGISTLKIIGPFSPIHLLIPYTLYSLWHGVKRARQGDIKGHKRSMTILVLMALIITGAFTLLPGRIMHQAVFGTTFIGAEAETQ